MRLTQSFAPRPRSAHAGFTLVELMITLVMLALVVAVIATVMIASQRSKADTEGRVEAQQSGRAISDIIVADLRTAGYQTDTDTSPAQTAFAYVDSTEIIINANQAPFPDTLATHGYPRAADPDATPLPPSITGAYVPGEDYTTGAEMIRYTLDLNDDGVIDAGDQAVPLAAEAQRTANPNDFVLARAVYGLQSGGGNGGSLEKVGLVRGPAVGIPYLFTVYLGSNPTPWSWHDGPIPASQLHNISRVTVRVTTEGRRARKDGTFPRSTLTTDVNSLRNSPNAASTLYSVSGFVYNDLNQNGVRDLGEPAVANAILRLGTAAVSQSSATGSYLVSAAPGQYILKQTPPVAYGSFGVDSIGVDFVASPVNVTHDFADTAMAGGWLVDTCFVDKNSNSLFDAGDALVDGVTLTCASQSTVTNASGAASMFLPVGTQSVSVTPPDSFIVQSTNPATVTITNGSSTTLHTILEQGGTGAITGTVFLDLNKNSVKDAGETGVVGAWVGATKDGGATFMGFGTSDATGAYSIIVPNNMPAAITPYTVTMIPPTGYYPVGTVVLSDIWVSTGQTVTGYDFSVINFTSISLTADRVLALGTAVLMPKTWAGSASQWASKSGMRRDLILCSEFASAPNVSVWFNQMNTVPIFNATYSYQRNAQSSALSIATGSIDTSTTSPNVLPREDMVVGLASKPSGNIAIWLTQNTSGNEGYMRPNPRLYQTNDAGDVNQVLLTDCAGGSALDLIVGTRTSSNVGTMEVWRGQGDSTFTREEIYPPQGNISGNTLGEVKAMSLSDVTGDGNPDLVVGTKSGDGIGKLHIFEFKSRSFGNRYRELNSYAITGEVTCLTVSDINQDGTVDIIVGTHISSVAGDIQWWRGNGSGSFSLKQTFVAPGPVLCIASADLGATSRNDLIFGFRTSDSDYSGGVRILYTDIGALPSNAVDPAGGTASYMTTSVAAANFNYRRNSTTPGPYYTDLAVAQKPSATTGNLLVFIR